AYELAQHLALDAEVHLYHDRQHGPVEPPYERLTTLHLHPLHGFSLLTMGSLANQLRDGGYDVIHIQYPSKGYGASTGPAFLPQNLSGMGSGSLIVVTLHEWLTSHPLRKMVMDQMLPSADVLMVTSEKEMHALVAKTGGKQVSVLPVGNVLSSRRELEAVWLEAEGKAAPSLPEPSGYGERMPLSLFHYGLPAKGKGLLRLLEALKLVRESGYPAMLYLGGDFSPGQPLSEEVLGAITKLELADSVVRLGSIPRPELEAAAEKYLLGVFPFDEGFSGKRSSVASISHLGLPIAVGAGSVEDHPYYAPEQNTGASLSVLLLELLSGGLEEKWEDQLAKQREYAQRFSFGRIAAGHLEVYRQLSRVAV
ncbi:glycosyltransferase, partial [bacterium]|nr:glycosyltransferase [bacterium]